MTDKVNNNNKDYNKFIKKVKKSYWFMIGSGKTDMILQNICSGDFLSNNNKF